MKDNNDILACNLLVETGLVTDKQVVEAGKIAERKRLYLGQTLIMAGYISPGQYKAASQAQSMIETGDLEEQTAIECLKIAKIACRSNESSADVVKRLSGTS